MVPSRFGRPTCLFHLPSDAGKDQQEKEEEAAAAKKARPVLDAIHERDTGNLRIRVNDGREISATGGASVEIALVDVGVVLFNPKTMVRVKPLQNMAKPVKRHQEDLM